MGNGPRILRHSLRVSEDIAFLNQANRVEGSAWSYKAYQGPMGDSIGQSHFSEEGGTATPLQYEMGRISAVILPGVYRAPVRNRDGSFPVNRFGMTED
jgi:hypothetical protein